MNASDEYSQCTEYAGATDEDLEWFEKFSFWIEGVFQLGLGKFSIGIDRTLTLLETSRTELFGHSLPETSAKVRPSYFNRN